MTHVLTNRLACLFLFLLSSAYCVADALPFNYDVQQRQAYVLSALQAATQTRPQSLTNASSYLYAIDKNHCQADSIELRLQCLRNYAQQNCQSFRLAKNQQKCLLYSDVAVVNRLGESVFLSKAERYRIAKQAEAGDLRAATEQGLAQKYAKLATRFYLSMAKTCKTNDITCIGQNIDDFCLAHANSQDVSWQYCTGALIWFISTSRAVAAN